MKTAWPVPYHRCAPGKIFRAEYGLELRTAYCYSCGRVIDLLDPRGASTITSTMFMREELKQLVMNAHFREE